jgi:hypothetical protein
VVVGASVVRRLLGMCPLFSFQGRGAVARLRTFRRPRPSTSVRIPGTLVLSVETKIPILRQIKLKMRHQCPRGRQHFTLG